MFRNNSIVNRRKRCVLLRQVGCIFNVAFLRATKIPALPLWQATGPGSRADSRWIQVFTKEKWRWGGMLLTKGSKTRGVVTLSGGPDVSSSVQQTSWSILDTASEVKTVYCFTGHPRTSNTSPHFQQNFW